MNKKSSARVKKIIKPAAIFACVILLITAGTGYYNEKSGGSIIIYSPKSIAQYDAESVYETVPDPSVDRSIDAAKESGEERLIIDINSADLEELQKLKGIGPAKAKLIIEYRELFGGFVCEEEIMEVRGIGPGIYEKIKDNIYVSTGKTGQDQ